MEKKKKKNIYFGQETEDAIVELNNTTDSKIKSKIYREKIEKPLNKLVENIINRFKFPYFKESVVDLQSEVISFLIMKMDGYDQSKGKAFSYFSILAKNHLIQSNNERWRNKKITQRIVSNESDFVYDIIDEEQEKRMNDDIPEFIKLMMDYWENNLVYIFDKHQEIKIADAILTLFRDSKNIENFNKKALFLMIRDMTDLRTQYITSVINIMREHNKKLMEKYNTDGIFDTGKILDDFL